MWDCQYGIWLDKLNSDHSVEILYKVQMGLYLYVNMEMHNRYQILKNGKDWFKIIVNKCQVIIFQWYWLWIRLTNWFNLINQINRTQLYNNSMNSKTKTHFIGNSRRLQNWIDLINKYWSVWWKISILNSYL